MMKRLLRWWPALVLTLGAFLVLKVSPIGPWDHRSSSFEAALTLQEQVTEDWLAREGYDEKMGARPMQRLIQEKIKRQLAEDLLFGELSKSGGTVRISVENDELSIDILSPVEA